VTGTGTWVDPSDEHVQDPEPVLRDALDRCIDALTGSVIRSGDRAGWLSWELAADGEPHRMVGGNASLYDGDAGVAWALVQLARVPGRGDLLDLAVRTARTAARTGANLRSGGLLDGTAGVAVGLAAVAAASGSAPGTSVGLLAPEALPASDLTSGLAGLLIAQSRAGSCGPRTLEAVDILRGRARSDPLGVCWPDPLASDPVEGRPLCGMSHGNSGIALALAEAAAAHPACNARASALAAEAMRWESAWFEPMKGGWPDLRVDPPGFPALWCHGAAGIGAARLRMLDLCEAGLDLPIPADTLRAEAEVAVQACGADLSLVVQGLERGTGQLAGGLTLCHGLGGPLDVLALAHELWGVKAHLEAARHFAAAIVRVLGDDPLAWPAGVRAPGSAGLFVGVAGAAVVLARLVHPELGLASPSLLV